MSVKGCKVSGSERLEIVTNNRDYEILLYCFLPIKYQKIADKEFVYLDDDDNGMEFTSGYFIYKRQLYNLSDFMYSSEGVYKFGKNREFRVDGHSGDSYFSSTIVQLDRSGESCKVARLYC